MEKDYRNIKVHPLLDPIKKLFEFVIFGNGFMIMPNFQRSFLEINPAAKSIIDTYNKEVNLTINGSKIHANIQPYLINTGRLMAIGIFDFLQFSKFNKKLNREAIYVFAKHIRNGAAHNNKFNFQGKNLSKPAYWKDKDINISLKGKTVIPDFINPFELLYLMEDISILIDSISKKQKAI